MIKEENNIKIDSLRDYVSYILDNSLKSGTFPKNNPLKSGKSIALPLFSYYFVNVVTEYRKAGGLRICRLRS